jgi:hypothetical protein
VSPAAWRSGANGFFIFKENVLSLRVSPAAWRSGANGFFIFQENVSR